MSVTKESITESLARIALPDGGDLVSRDMIRALTVEGGNVRFVIEAPDPQQAARMAPVRDAAEASVKSLSGVTSVSVILTTSPRISSVCAPSTGALAAGVRAFSTTFRL